MNVSGDFDIFTTVSMIIVFVGCDAVKHGKCVQMPLVHSNTDLPNHTAISETNNLTALLFLFNFPHNEARMAN
jgi:hypothetical protein